MSRVALGFHAAKLRRLRQGFDAIASPRAILRLALRDAVALFGADSGSVALINPETGLLEIEVAVGLGRRGRALRLPLSRGITGWVAAHGTCARVADVARDPRYVPARAGVRSEAAAPIFDRPAASPLRRVVVGVLNLDSNRPNAFGAGCEPRLRAVAGEIASLVRNIWRYAETRARARDLDRLLAISRRIAGEDTREGVLARVVRGATSLLRASAAGVFELSEDGESLAWTAAHPARLRRRAPVRIPVEHSFLGVVALTRGASSVSDARRSDPFLTRCLARHRALGACLAAPFAASAHSRGTLAVFSVAGRRFSDRETELLRTLGAVAALSLQRADLARRLLGVEDTLRRGERLASIGLIAAEVAHEIRNPLTVIGLLARNLARDADEAPARARDAEVLIRKIDQLNRILERVLGLARGSEPDRQPVALNAVVEDLALLLRHKLAEQKVRLTLRLSPRLPTVRADRSQIEQALLNLALNALHAMRDGGRLFLTTGVAAAGTWIEVRDTGRGIPRARLKTLFDPLLGARETGSGLGMAIVRKIVQAHDGAIEVRSRPGRGARIRILFPNPRIPPASDENAPSSFREG